MIQTSYLTSLVSALRAETAINSITPETLGSVLQRIVDAMANGLTSEDLTGIGGSSGGVSDAEMAAINGSITELKQQVNKNKNDILSLHNPATRLSNGLMSAADKIKLDSLSPSGSSGSGSSSGEGIDYYDLAEAVTALQTSMASIGSLIGTVNVSQLASWYSNLATPVLVMRQAQQDPAIYVVMGTFAGKPKPCGILFSFMDDMNSTAQPHAIHQLFFSNFTSMTNFGHDGGIHLWHRLYAITAHHGAIGSWSNWTELSFGGGGICSNEPVTTTTNGLMISTDKAKLDRLAISSISLSGNTLTINGKSFSLTPTENGSSNPPSSEGGGNSSGSESGFGGADYEYSEDIIIQ